MLDQFYSYLSKNIVTYFENRKIKSGDKFNIQFEKEDEVLGMYDAIKRENKIKEFVYNSHSATYKTYSIDINGTELLIACTNKNTTDDFLIRLRNLAGDESEIDFKSVAILFIHNTTLDSLVRGTESLKKEGMPLHITSLLKDIKSRVPMSSINNEEKQIINFVLDRMNKDILEHDTSIFEYSAILDVLNKGSIKKEEYNEFSLFYDEGLKDNLSNKAIKERLIENSKLFMDIESIHKYGNPELELEKIFDLNGVNKLKKDDWQEINYKDVKMSKEKKENTTKAEIENVNIQNENIVIWDKPDGETTAKRRKRNILVFNNKNLDQINLEVLFNINVKQKYLKLDKKSELHSGVIANGKKAIISINANNKENTFTKVIYNDEVVRCECRICIVNCEENMFKSIKSNYEVIIKPKVQLLVSNTDENKIILNDDKNLKIREILKNVDNSVTLSSDETMEVNFDVQPHEENDFIKVNIEYNNTNLTLGKRNQKEDIRPISGNKIWKLKREKEESFIYSGENKLIQGTSEYFAREDFKENLEIEKSIIDTSAKYIVYDNYIDFYEVELDIEENIKKSYDKLVNYYAKNNLLPSLAYFDDELLILSREYLRNVIEFLEQMPNGEILSKSQGDIWKLGTIYRSFGSQEILLTPLHPINVAYQILINDSMKNEEVNDNILKILNSKYLMPYMYKEKDKLYKVMDQNHSPEWSYYVDYSLNRYKGSRDFVLKLTSEKVSEFISHFKYLFRNMGRSKLKLKLINLGDCREVLSGIFDYYIKEINKYNDINNLISMEIYVYGDKSVINSFEQISMINSIEDIESIVNINSKIKEYSLIDILKIFRQKVNFYNKNKYIDEYEYSHLTLYEMDQDVTINSSSMENINTGINLGGLISGSSSVFLKDSYRTGFGSKFLDKNSNDLLNISAKYNSITKAIGTQDPFDDNLSITTSISDSDKEFLSKIYKSSNWVTFIDPKVDLNFFKNDINVKDLLIIHYSDQYTTSSGYDSITVTRKSDQYQFIIEEFLSSKEVTRIDNDMVSIINNFNAINGDWLLRMISSKSQFPREKISILSAMKISLAYFYHPDIVWVPISLEEILRVSGGTGLSQKDGLFTAKNLTGNNSSYSDDLLLVGIEEINENVQIHFYPVEVKIGENSSSVMDKAIEQANKTANLLKEKLITNEDDENPFLKTIYRNFMMQLVINSVEKMKLYGVWNDQDWDFIVNTEIRTKLLNDDYKINLDLDEYIGKGCVVSFKKDTYFNTNPSNLRNNITVLDLAESQGYNNINSDITKLKESYSSGDSDFNKDNLLINKYKQFNNMNNLGIKLSIDQKSDENSSLDLAKNYYSSNDELENINNVSENIICDEIVYTDETVSTKEENIYIEGDELELNNRQMEIMFGTRKENNKPLIWYPTDTNYTSHTNTGIIGTMGTGKTQFTKSMVTQLHRESVYNVDSKKLGILIFDYKGDYIDDEFVNATDAKVYDLYRLPYNPLSIIIPDRPKPMLPLHTAGTLTETIRSSFNLGIKQKTLLKELIIEAYEQRGIKKGSPDTWNKVAPTINDVCSIYFGREDVKEDSLYAALTNLYDFEIFESDNSKTTNLFDLIDGVTVINLSGYDKSIQNLVVAITLDLFYTQMLVLGESKQENGFRQLNKMVLVDEADNFLSKNFTSIKKILKEGRMFGVGTILSTQLLSHFSTGSNEYQNYISTWIVHNVSDLNNKDVKYIFNTKSKNEEDNIYNKIKSLLKHESLVKVQNDNSPIFIRDKAFWELDK
ncbi:MAG: DNA phosphorothioation-dependent restriction protein DptH [Peptostreptococcaceae bacterium]